MNKGKKGKPPTKYLNVLREKFLQAYILRGAETDEVEADTGGEAVAEGAANNLGAAEEAAAPKGDVATDTIFA